MKPVKRSGLASRSERGEHVQKDMSETWETRWSRRQEGVNPSRECIIWKGARRESDGLIVAMKQGNACEAKEPCCMHANIDKARAAWEPDSRLRTISNLGNERSVASELNRRSAVVNAHARKPCTGNLYARFDEGSGGKPRSYSTVILPILSSRKAHTKTRRHEESAKELS